MKRGKAELIPWLQDFSYGRTYGLAEVKAQIEAARLMGARGYLLWNPLGVYTPGALAPRDACYDRRRMAIGDVMRTRVVSVETGDSARLAVLRMLEEGVGSVAVTDGGQARRHLHRARRSRARGRRHRPRRRAGRRRDDARAGHRRRTASPCSTPRG